MVASRHQHCGRILDQLAEKLTHPLVQAGSKLQGGPGAEQASPGKSFLLGISTGLLWAPCAGPILGLILTGAAIQGPGPRSTFLLLAYALGAALSLAIALLAGKKVLSTMKRSLGFDVWIRRGIGIAVISGVIAIALGWDTNLLTKFSFVNTARAESRSVFGYDPRADFIAFDPDYPAKHAQSVSELERLQQELAEKAAKGRATPCSRQLFLEARWLTFYSALWDQIVNERRVELAFEEHRYFAALFSFERYSG